MDRLRMHTEGNTTMGFVSGVVGGLGSFLLDIKIGMMDDMLIAIITACLCGAAGVAGKEAYHFLKIKLQKKWRVRNSKKD